MKRMHGMSLVHCRAAMLERGRGHSHNREKWMTLTKRMAVSEAREVNIPHPWDWGCAFLTGARTRLSRSERMAECACCRRAGGGWMSLIQRMGGCACFKGRRSPFMYAYMPTGKVGR